MPDNTTTPALDPREQIAQGIAAYLLGSPYKVKITGPAGKVNEFTEALKELKEILPQLQIRSDEGEPKVEEGGILKTLVAGMVGYILGRKTGIKLAGPKNTVNKIVGALDRIRTAIKK